VVIPKVFGTALAGFSRHVKEKFVCYTVAKRKGEKLQNIIWDINLPVISKTSNFIGMHKIRGFTFGSNSKKTIQFAMLAFFVLYYILQENPLIVSKYIITNNGCRHRSV
jgi:hypothetical protein